MTRSRRACRRGHFSFLLAVAVLLAACESRLAEVGVSEHALVAARQLSELSTVVDNFSSLPGGFTVVDDMVLFFAGERNVLLRTDGTPAGTQILRDRGSTFDSLDGRPFIVAFNDRAYWSQSDGLWTSDGTVAGTGLVFLAPSGQEPTEPVVYDGALYFGLGNSLYRSDGTAAGTQVAAAIAPSGISRWQVMDGLLYLPCSFPASGLELCVTDGTAAGTRVVRDLRTGSQSSSPRILGVLGSKLLFTAEPESIRRGLWATDGTTAGTLELLTPPNPGDAVGYYQDDFIVFGGQAFVPCYTSATGSELCRTDGTRAGTSVIDFVPGAGSGSPSSLVVLGAQLVFTMSTPATGRELWTSDGTLAGTSLVVELQPGTSDGVRFDPIVPMDGSLYFVASRGFTSSEEVWKTDGTAQGTVRVADILPPGFPGSYSISMSSGGVLGNRLVFAAFDGVTGLEPWVTDGTAAGTLLLRDVEPEKSRAEVYEMLGFQGGVYLTVNDTQGTKLWRSDGTAAGTGPFQEGGAFALTPVRHWLFFGGPGGLRKTDGTSPGVLVTELPGNVTELHALGDRLAFAGATPDLAVGLWLSDGTAAGTGLTDPAVLNARRLGVANGRVWLTGLDGPLGNELWTSDGTSAGTYRVKDIRVGSGSSEPQSFVGLNGETLFVANDGVSGFELWKTDGTDGGTVRVADIRPGSASGSPFELFTWNDMVLFWAAPGSAHELWKTDGTGAGTILVEAVKPGFGSKFVAWDDQVFFTAVDAAGTELWRTDGTAAGTVMVSDIYPGPLSSEPEDLVLAGPEGPLFFAAEEPIAGREVWQLTAPTGTPELLADIVAGAQSSRPEFLAVKGSSLIVVADDGSGRALFELEGVGPDGTPPIVVCPDDVTVTATSSSGVAVSYEPPGATDDSGVLLSVTADGPSGAIFPVGVTDVTVAATDTSNNTSRCSFRVEVTVEGEPDGGVSDAGPGTLPDGGTGGDTDAGMNDAGPGQPSDAGMDGDTDAGPDMPPGGGDGDSGCGCGVAGGSSWPTSALLFLLVAGLLLRRPRATPRPGTASR
jgi:ELWxxDGT repeat protein